VDKKQIQETSYALVCTWFKNHFHCFVAGKIFILSKKLSMIKQFIEKDILPKVDYN